ncbi:MAG: PA2778 family cysteine peptidase [Pseudomonadales bacterium]|nr:PA2778 family cysteine peptidase [Pseudomonadales bacterium]
MQALVLLASACSNIPPLDDDAWDAFPAVIEHQAVPYFEDDPYQCGPQSLAMVLSFSDKPVQPTELIESVYVPDRKGSFAPELRAAARTQGRLPYRIDPALPDLMTVLADGYPVLIMQNVGLGFAPVWHFAVTIGFDRSEDAFILRTGPHERLEMSTVKFERRWRLADYWAIVLLAPDDFPVWVSRRQYEDQLALMEDVWSEQMETIYRRMETRWPDSTMALLGLGNIAYGRGDLAAAAGRYESVLAIDSTHIGALNNLAEVSLDLGDPQRARALTCRALPLVRGHPLADYIADLDRRLESMHPELNCESGP